MPLLANYPTIPLPPPSTFANHTILITGATSGLGLATAIHYATLGAHRILITSRTASAGALAAAHIESVTNRPGLITVLPLDLSALSTLPAFAASLARAAPTIDIVLLNAGVHPFAHTTTEGFEEAIHTNALATALLALLLLPWLKRAPSPVEGRPKHLGLVSSSLATVPGAGLAGWPREDVLGFWSKRENWGKGQKGYARSKLFLEYAGVEIARLARSGEVGAPVIVNTLCPGGVRTALARSAGAQSRFLGLAAPLYALLMCQTAEAGSRAFVRAAADRAPEAHGRFVKYYGSEKEFEGKYARVMTSEEGKRMQKVVWGEMVEVFEGVVPGVVEAAAA